MSSNFWPMSAKNLKIELEILYNSLINHEEHLTSLQNKLEQFHAEDQQVLPQLAEIRNKLSQLSASHEILTAQILEKTSSIENTVGVFAAEQRTANTQILEKTSFIENTVGVFSAEQRTANTQIFEKTSSIENAVGVFSAEQQNSHSQLNVKIDSILATLFHKEYSSDVRFEREYYKKFPTAYSPEFPDFQEKFLSLMAGLDDESIKTVALAIQRLKIVQNSEEPLLPLFSEEEKQVLRQLEQHFYSTILPLSETCFYYNGYLLPIHHFEACVFWDLCSTKELEHPELFAQKDIIDAGGFIGDSALVLAKLTTGQVHAFEPTPSNYELMLKTIDLNHCENIIPCPYALGDKPGKLTINTYSSCSTAFTNDAIAYDGAVEAEMTTLDDYVRENNLQVGLIKVDVEGAEQMLLKGAMETIKTQKPTLIISIYHNASDFFDIKPMLEALNLGYRFKIRHPVCGTVMTETVLIAEL